jgi:hypothetical protein
MPNNLIDPEWLRKHGEKYITKIKARKEEERRKREQGKGKPENPETQNPSSSGIITVPEQGMIYVESVNLWFNPERTHKGKDWYQTHEALNAEKLRMPTVYEFVEFLKFIKNGNTGLQALYNDITEVGGEWKAEWLDAYFPEINGKLNIQYHNHVQNGKIISGTPEGLDCLMEDKQISLDGWISNPTKHGLPRANATKGEMYSYFPKEGRVARLLVNFCLLCLNCSGIPANANGALGVFGCAEGGAKNGGQSKCQII